MNLCMSKFIYILHIHTIHTCIILFFFLVWDNILSLKLPLNTVEHTQFTCHNTHEVKSEFIKKVFSFLAFFSQLKGVKRRIVIKSVWKSENKELKSFSLIKFFLLEMQEIVLLKNFFKTYLFKNKVNFLFVKEINIHRVNISTSCN